MSQESGPGLAGSSASGLKVALKVLTVAAVLSQSLTGERSSKL